MWQKKRISQTALTLKFSMPRFRGCLAGFLFSIGMLPPWSTVAQHCTVLRAFSPDRSIFCSCLSCRFMFAEEWTPVLLWRSHALPSFCSFRLRDRSLLCLLAELCSSVSFGKTLPHLWSQPCLPLLLLILCSPYLDIFLSTTVANYLSIYLLDQAVSFLRVKWMCPLPLVPNKVTSIEQELHNYCSIIKGIFKPPKNCNRKRTGLTMEKQTWGGWQYEKKKEGNWKYEESKKKI